MPKRILIIGILFCLNGLAAGWDMVSAPFENRFSLNLAVLMLPVGIGLLRGRDSSRRWANVWIVLGFAMCAILVFMMLFSPGNVSLTWFHTKIVGPDAFFYGLVGLVTLVPALAIVMSLLNSPKSLAWFSMNSARSIRG